MAHGRVSCALCCTKARRTERSEAARIKAPLTGASRVALVLLHEGGHARCGHGRLHPVQELADGERPHIWLGQRILQKLAGVGRKLVVLQEGRVDGDLHGPAVAAVGGVKGAAAAARDRAGGSRVRAGDSSGGWAGWPAAQRSTGWGALLPQPWPAQSLLLTGSPAFSAQQPQQPSTPGPHSSLLPPAVWATRGPVIALRDKRV